MANLNAHMAVSSPSKEQTSRVRVLLEERPSLRGTEQVSRGLRGGRVPEPRETEGLTRFLRFTLRFLDWWLDLLMKQGFSTPSAVQAAAWPLAASGRDVLAVAKTGSGKTLGYLLPALARCHTGWEKAAGKSLCLVMAPTRELALQIKDEATKFGAPLGVRAVAVYGGAPKWGQTAELQRGCEIIIAGASGPADEVGS
jgi:superfamily II DNA/RNA helicase